MSRRETNEQVQVKRTWKRDGSWNLMPLRVALDRLRTQLRKQEEPALECWDRLRRELLSGRVLDTKLCFWQVV